MLALRPRARALGGLFAAGLIALSLSSSAGAGTTKTLSSGCERVPPSGNIGPGVYGQTGTHSSSSWNWSGGSAGQSFHWYVITSGGTIKAHGPGSGPGSVSVPAGTYYWKVQNQGSSPQSWNACWS
jgi:hypothetical protein